jgi:uncharacterized membrane protein
VPKGIEEGEVIGALLTLGVLVFLATDRDRVRRLPAWRWLVASFVALAVSSLFTVAEDVVLPGPLNLLEHLFLAVSAVLLARWCWLVSQGEAQGGQ